jgi:hypothetical protein
MSKYKLIVMSFDGEYKTEHPEFETIDKAWEYSNDLGSKWYFYPFHFVVTQSTKTVKAAGYFLEFTEGLRTKTVARIFEDHSKKEETKGMDAEAFAISL